MDHQTIIKFKIIQSFVLSSYEGDSKTIALKASRVKRKEQPLYVIQICIRKGIFGLCFAFASYFHYLFNNWYQSFDYELQKDNNDAGIMIKLIFINYLI